MNDVVGELCSNAHALQGGLLTGLFVAGAAGSVVHCGPMCGAFVLGQVSERMARVPLNRMCERQRVGNGLLLPYHTGRVTTYALLGALAGESTAAIGHAGWFRYLATMMLLTAALLFASHALRRAAGRRPAPSVASLARSGAPRRRDPGLALRLARWLDRHSARDTPHREFLLGAALGLLPCGLLYAALMSAAASESPAIGAAGMVMFGLGTTPLLAAIGIAGNAAGQRYTRVIQTVAPAFMSLNAALLIVLAWRSAAPF